MLKNTRHIFWIAAVVLLGMIGCTKEETITGGETLPTGEAVSVTLALCVDDLQTPGVKSKSAETGTSRVIHSERSEAMLLELIEEPEQNQPQTRAMNDSQIANIWVFQYDGTEPTSKLIRKDYYASYTEGMKFELYARASQRVAVIANTFNATFGNDQTLNTSTYQTLLDKTATVGVQNHVLTNGGDNIPFSGTSTEAVKEASSINMNLMRNVAQVIFKVKTGNVVANNWTIQMRDVPNVSYWMAQRDDTPFPASVTPVNYAVQTITDMSSDNFSEFSWYVPTNLRGTVDGTTAKQRVTNAPAGATYVKITGETTPFAGVSYTIHLGADFATDYNIRPNYKYTYQVTFYTDPSGADSRVVMTEATAFDYTDNGTPWFAVAKEDAPSPLDGSRAMNWYIASGTQDATSNPDALKACPDGWRLPTDSELKLMWVYKKGLGPFYPEPTYPPTTSLGFWSSTPYYSGNTDCYKMNLAHGYLRSSRKTNSENNAVRCVRDIPAQTGVKKYPYVDADGQTIVSRDESGGVPTTSLLSQVENNWLINNVRENYVAYTEIDEHNKASAKFKVSAKYAWDSGNMYGGSSLEDAVVLEAVCRDNYLEDWVNGSDVRKWRLPTQRELYLMVLLRDSLTAVEPFYNSKNKSVHYYKHWSSTLWGGSKTKNNSWYVNFDNYGEGRPPVVQPVTLGLKYNIRCVRDIE